jgi:polysaccharide biosynthesis/export protein VpsN
MPAMFRVFLIVLASIFGTAHAAKPNPAPAAATDPVRDPVRAASDIAESYRVSPADTLSVEVFGEEDLTKEFTISESGTIAFPLIGTVKVGGLRSIEIEKLLNKKLRKGFLLNPRVTVTVRGYRPFFVSGQVISPGSFKFEPGLTVRKAVTMAGGFTERASKSKIYVVSEGANTSKPRKVKLDDALKPGDVITVEESFF